MAINFNVFTLEYYMYQKQKFVSLLEQTKTSIDITLPKFYVQNKK